MGGRAADHISDLIDRLFSGRSARYGPYDKFGEAEELLEGLLYRHVLTRPNDLATRFEALVYDGISGLAGALWEQEVRALLRLSALGHPALPEIHTGGYDEGDRCGFILTRLPGGPMRLNEIVPRFQADPPEALRQLSLLLDALAYLHDLRIQHRNLTPSAIQVQEEGEGSERRIQLLLKRFEMSTFVSNILLGRDGSVDRASTAEQMRRMLLEPPQGIERARHLCYVAPERLPFLLGTGPVPRHEWGTTDVYGLGVMAWEWFCGALPDVLGEEYGAVARAAAAGGSSAVAALARLNTAMRRYVAGRRQLPAPLVDLLRNALHPHPRERWTAYQCARKLEHHWDHLMALCERSHTGRDRPYLVAFMPNESAKTLYLDDEAAGRDRPGGGDAKRRWLTRDPRTPAGRDELADLLRRDLRKAHLVHSPAGALGYASGPNEEALRRAAWVLIGTRAVWFCEHLKLGREICRDILVIKYVKEIESARDLAIARPRRLVRQVEVMSWEVGQDVAEGDRRHRPDWTELTASVRSSRERTESEARFLQSLDLQLRFQQVQLQAREYAFERVGDEGSGHVRLTVDRARDEKRRLSSDLLTAYSGGGRRKPLGSFLASLESEDDVLELELTGREDRPAFGRDQSSRVRYVDSVPSDPTSVIVAPLRGNRVPSRGWLRPAEDGAAHVNLNRQLRARATLELVPGLVRNLWLPQSLDASRGRWRSVADRFPGEKQLAGEAPEVIRDILSLHPFYALQGPPGTGKTTVAARAIKYFLGDEPTAQVLISAQSNYALDNLAEAVKGEIGDRYLMLREAPPERVGDLVSDAMRPHILSELTETVLGRAVARVRGRLRRGAASGVPHARDGAVGDDGEGGDVPLDEVRREILHDWVTTHESIKVEMSERIRRVANVVCATCSYAGAGGTDVLTGGAGAPADVTSLYDWVVVEEAAKAWPTELVIPLTRGLKWTLLGDHKQLGAHRDDEFRDFLASLSSQRNDDLLALAQQLDLHVDTLQLFGSLFERREDRTAGVEGVSGSGATPLGRLRRQFRMRSAIAQPVSRAFYPDPERDGERDGDGLPFGSLETDDSTEVDAGIVRPSLLARESLVWIDTTGDDYCGDRPRWSNPGEVEVVERIVDVLHPPPAPPGDRGPLTTVVLTPYRAQRQLLEQRAVLRRRVHTVHSFQGRQADVVIVSLVRDTVQGTASVTAHVGHVGRDEVVNVLLSRARRLLVLVGSFEHFAARGGPSWDVVCRTIETYGRVGDVADLCT